MANVAANFLSELSVLLAPFLEFEVIQKLIFNTIIKGNQKAIISIY